MKVFPKATPKELEHRVYHKLVIALRYKWYCLLPVNFNAFWDATLRHQEHVTYEALPFSLPGGVELSPMLLNTMKKASQPSSAPGV